MLQSSSCSFKANSANWLQILSKGKRMTQSQIKMVLVQHTTKEHYLETTANNRVSQRINGRSFTRIYTPYSHLNLNHKTTYMINYLLKTNNKTLSRLIAMRKRSSSVALRLWRRRSQSIKRRELLARLVRDQAHEDKTTFQAHCYDQF